MVSTRSATLVNTFKLLKKRKRLQKGKERKKKEKKRKDSEETEHRMRQEGKDTEKSETGVCIPSKQR